jgi:tetratricopeptide (TPR) repeat protein
MNPTIKFISSLCILPLMTDQIAEFCENCGMSNTSKNKYCQTCGTSLIKNTGTAPQPLEAQPATVQQPAHPSWYIPPVSNEPINPSVQTPVQPTQGSTTGSTIKKTSIFKWIAICCGGAFLVLILIAFIAGMARPIEDAAFHEKKGISLMDSHEFKKALSEFDQTVNLDPKSYWGYVWRGIAQYQLGNYSAAIDNYNIAIGLNQTNKWGYFFRGQANDAQDNSLNAILDYSKAIELDPQYLNSYVKRGTASIWLQNYTSAKLDFTTAIDQDPESTDMVIAQAYVGRGIANFGLNNYNDAALDFTNGLPILLKSPNPNVDDLYSTYVWRGTCYMKLGDDEQAKMDILRINTYYPNYVPSDAYIIQLRDKLIEHYNSGKTSLTTPNNPTETPPTVVTTQITRKVTPTPRDTYKPHQTAPILYPYTYRVTMAPPNNWNERY